MNNYETDSMADSDVETEKQTPAIYSKSVKKRGRPQGFKTIKKAKTVYGRPKKQIKGQSSLMAFAMSSQPVRKNS